MHQQFQFTSLSSSSFSHLNIDSFTLWRIVTISNWKLWQPRKLSYLQKIGLASSPGLGFKNKGLDYFFIISRLKVSRIWYSKQCMTSAKVYDTIIWYISLLDKAGLMGLIVLFMGLCGAGLGDYFIRCARSKKMIIFFTKNK